MVELTNTNKIREYREYYGISIRKLAEMCDVSAMTISCAERGVHVPNIYLGLRLARILRVAPEILFPEEKNEEREDIRRWTL